MAILKPGTFTEWDLTTRERLAGSVISTDQEHLLQNDLAMIAEQRLNIDFDGVNPIKFAQDESFLKGQMAILHFILLRSSESSHQLQHLQD